jgi:hypothetical protein
MPGLLLAVGTKKRRMWVFLSEKRKILRLFLYRCVAGTRQWKLRRADDINVQEMML